MKKALLLFILLAAALLGACAEKAVLPAPTELLPPAASREAAVEEMLQRKIEAVETGNLQLYLQQLDPQAWHPTYAKEQENWFGDIQAQGIKGLQMSVGKMVADVGFAYGEMTLAYTYQGQQKSCVLPMRFRLEQTDDGYIAYDCGYDFLLMENDRLAIYYAGENEALVAKLFENAQGQIDRVCAIFETMPSKLIVNFYPQREQMLFSVKASIPDWAGGWTEAEESVKMYAYGSNAVSEAIIEEYYLVTIAHETVHLVVFDLSGGNASFWLQEGLAGLFEDEDQQSILLPAKWFFARELKFAFRDFAALEKADYEKITESMHAAIYYDSCELAAKLAYDHLGMAGLKQAMAHMAGLGEPPAGYSQAKIDLLAERTRQGFAQAGYEEGLQKAYDQKMAEFIAEE